MTFTDAQIDGEAVVADPTINDIKVPHERPTAWDKIRTFEETPVSTSPTLQEQIDDALCRYEIELEGQRPSGALLGAIAQKLTLKFKQIILVTTIIDERGQRLAGYAQPQVQG